MMMPLQGPLKGVKILGAPTPRRSQSLFSAASKKHDGKDDNVSDVSLKAA